VDLLELLHGAATGRLRGEVQARDEAAVTVVLAAPELPASERLRGSTIEGLEDARGDRRRSSFHAGTAIHGDRLVTNGGRILNVTGMGADLAAAREAAYAGAARISFAGARYRTDIAADAEARVG
jgi:phosphoribosylamine--glycine ligase